MADGTVVGGLAERQERYEFPAWIRGRHRGAIRIFIQRPNNIGYIVTNIVTLPTHHNNHIMRAILHLAEEEAAQAILSPIGPNLPENTRARIYVGLPDGRTFTGYFV